MAKEESLKEYRLKIIGKKGPQRVHKSMWVKDMYRWCVKNKLITYAVSEATFKLIVRTVNAAIADKIAEGHTVPLPVDMGKLGLVKIQLSPFVQNNRVVIPYKIDWGETLKMWYEDDEAETDKTLIRYESNRKFYFNHFKRNAKFNNKMYFEFIPARSLRRRLYDKLHNEYNNIDAVLKY